MLVEIFIGIFGLYISYKLEKIDKRQDEIEIVLAEMRFRFPKRSSDSVD